MKQQIEKIVKLLKAWNEVSNYLFTYEVTRDDEIYIENMVTPEVTTMLFSLLYHTANGMIVYLDVEKNQYSVKIRVLAI